MPRDIPTNSDNIIDSRDIIARIDELTEERDDLQAAIDEAGEEVNRLTPDADSDEAETGETPEGYEDACDEFAAARCALADWEADNADELRALESLAEEGENCASDWRYGETLIRRTYWVDYVQDLVSDIGDMPREVPSYIAIDWNQTARNVEVDYTTVDFDGTEYLIRCS